VLDGVDAVRRGDGADDGAQRTTGVGLGKAGVFVALALEEVRERVCAAWMNQQSTWLGLYPAMPILAPDSNGISCWRHGIASPAKAAVGKSLARGAASP
jgi:hypothetical protein